MVKDLVKGNRIAKGGAAALDDLTSGLNELVNSGTTFENIQRVIIDFNKGVGFAEGAGWVMQYITKNASEFENQVLKFEQNVISGRVDLIMGEVLYEFKSVKNLPPDKFVKQVARDLKNVKKLEDMKWIFDKSKLNNVSSIKQVDREKMLDALGGMVLDKDVIKKFVQDSPFDISSLVDEIDKVFNKIFKT